ncbi:aluminum-activated malate transporter 9-like [Bidens hawaiensis]|uniref:aluminum-activated malate transporter 9-like n=1 Tax=Bidens hawaiensis TaxID=980011 RepID=UPI00404ADF40
MKEGGFVVEILTSTKDEQPKTSNKVAVFMHAILEFAKEDNDRVTFSLKVGLAVLLVSLLILIQAPYQVFGTTIIWSILTVAIMFEYTVGATFHKGFNRALGSLFAGVLAIAVTELALMGGPVAEPFIIAISIFMIGTVTSFMKLWPTFVPYEYGFRVILFTYCLIIVSGYRMGNPIRTSIDRFYSIVIGAIVTLAVNTLVFPIWAGEQLHKELVNNFNSVADSLEECVKKYLADDGSYQPMFIKTLMDEFPDEPAYKKFRSTLNSSAKLESLALSAKWEPPHGRFRQAFYPWSEYVKVDTVLRYCAYKVMGLHGVLHSQIQAPYNIRGLFETEILEATSKAAELIRCLSQDICDMKQTQKCSLLKSAHSSTERLQRAIDTRLFNKDNNVEEDEMNYQSQRQSMSLVTFTSLLVEFVARLDHLVEAVNDLSKMAKFKGQSL